jgi:anti-sigma regulatory factor (Ser/Thr protein kinase)
MGKSMPNQLALELTADMAELERLNDAIDSFGETSHWSEKSLFQVKLAIEEVVINTLSHGFNGQHGQRILLKLIQVDHHLTVEISDNAVAFDPLQRPPPDLNASLEDREVGGLGIYLARQMMDSVAYQRIGDWNHLLMTKTM